MAKYRYERYSLYWDTHEFIANATRQETEPPNLSPINIASGNTGDAYPLDTNTTISYSRTVGYVYEHNVRNTQGGPAFIKVYEILDIPQYELMSGYRIRGAHIDDITSDTTLPIDGISGNYWYVRQEEVTVPSMVIGGKEIKSIQYKDKNGDLLEINTGQYKNGAGNLIDLV